MRKHFDENHVWMRIGVSPSDVTVWRAIDGATVLQQGSHCVALRAIEGATVLQQVMREKGKLEEAMHCAQNDHRPCLVDAAREVGRNTQMTSNSMHRLFCNN